MSEKGGARFVLNSQFFHIAQPGEAFGKYAKSSNAAANLVEYVATRETVALNLEGDIKNEPATEKQKEYLNQLKEFLDNPDEVLEYQDYVKNPTKQNASYLIAYLEEQAVMNDFNEVSNLVEYVALRPSVVKVGEHGLFSSDSNIDLEAAKEELSNHKGNIYTHVLSLRREDADKLGFDSQTPWKNLIKSKLDVIAKNHGLDINEMHWYAGMHNTGSHPHVHLFVYADENATHKPYFDKKNIKTLKSEFANDIFFGEMFDNKVNKSEYRNELNNKSRELLNTLMENPNKYFNDEQLKGLVNKIIKLSQNLPTKGTMTYGWMPKNVKAMIDDIQKDFVYQNAVLNQLYMNYCNMQYNIEQMYITNPTQAPVDKVKDFIPIKNEILRQAVKIRDFGMPKPSPEIKDISALNEIINKNCDKIDNSDKAFSHRKIEDLEYASLDLKLRNSEVCFQLANYYNYGIDGTLIDVPQAMIWYSIAYDQFKNNIAGYELARLYEKGADGVEPDIKQAQHLYAEVFNNLNIDIENSDFFLALKNDKDIDNTSYLTNTSKTDAYEEYLIGKMYLDGKGVEQDSFKAFVAFTVAADNGYISANYKLAYMYFNGIGTNKDIDMAVNCLKKIAKDNPDLEYQLGNIYSDKEYEHNDNKVAQVHYANALQEYIKYYTYNPSDNTAYKIGTMYHFGIGVEQDIDKAVKWYKEAQKLGNEQAEQKSESIEKQRNASVMSVASTVAHFGKIIDTQTHAAAKQHYTSDSKILRQEKIKKIASGQATDDNSFGYDY